MKRVLFASLVLGAVLVSCGDPWTEQHEEEFLLHCEKSFVLGFENSLEDKMYLVDRKKLDKLAHRYCDCAYNHIKKTYESPEEAFQNGVEALLEEAESSKDCEITEKDIDNLLQR